MVKTIFLIVLVIVILSIAIISDSDNDKKMKKIRSSSLAGSWYERNPEVLSSQIDTFLENVPKDAVKQDIIGIIAPHAGYAYSAQTAAYAYKCLKDSDINRVIVLASSHYSVFNGIAITDATHFETPLGIIEVDIDTVNALSKNPVFEQNENAHGKEHSLEIQLPLIQKILKNFKIIPLIVGNLDENDNKTAARLISKYLDDKTVIVASSDFTHFGARFDYIPFDNNIKENLKILDMGAIDKIKAHDTEKFLEYIYKTGATICGYRPIALLLEILPKDSGAELLKYTTSGELTGDYHNSVSYASIVFTGKFENKKEDEIMENKTPEEQGNEEEYLSKDEQEFLLKLSREILNTFVETKKIPDFHTNEELNPKLKGKAGVFGTLTKFGQLRGCIGYIQPIEALYKAVIKNTINAAVHDTRFVPVNKDELSDIDIEISVLTPPKKVSGYEDIIIGKHGMILEKFGRSAVFLPQVAIEQEWDLATTLTHLSYKAGLPGDAWREGTTFLVFTAQVFGKKE